MLDVIMKIPSILDRRVVQGASKLYARVTTAWFYSLGLLQIGVKKLTRNIESNFDIQSRKNKFVHSSRENDEKSFLLAPVLALFTVRLELIIGYKESNGVREGTISCR